MIANQTGSQRPWNQGGREEERFYTELSSFLCMYLYSHNGNTASTHFLCFCLCVMSSMLFTYSEVLDTRWHAASKLPCICMSAPKSDDQNRQLSFYAYAKANAFLRWFSGTWHQTWNSLVTGKRLWDPCYESTIVFLARRSSEYVSHVHVISFKLRVFWATNDNVMKQKVLAAEWPGVPESRRGGFAWLLW